jgi:ribose 5-phosphate isomerase B
MLSEKIFNKVGFGSDHGGIDLKDELISYVKSIGYEIIDYGTYSSESVDYPIYAAKVASGIINKEVDCGIICCGTGIGISIAANKFPNIRAALCHDYYTAQLSRQHNNANILAMGGRTTGIETAKQMVSIWLETEFEAGRHQRRIDMFDNQVKEFWKDFLK